MMTPGKHQSKLSTCTMPMRFLSINAHSTSTYHILLLDTGCITHTHNVVFNEQSNSTQANKPITHTSLPLVLDSIDSWPDIYDLLAPNHTV